MSQPGDLSQSGRRTDGEAPENGAPTVAQWENEVRAEAEANSGVVATKLGPYYEDYRRLVRLPDVKPPPDTSTTEALLNGLIEDCRFLIREVAFHSARLTPDANHRLQFLSSAETLVVTGAKVGRTIAKLRQERPEPDENRYRMIIEHVQSQPRKPAKRGGREGVKKRRDSKIQNQTLAARGSVAATGWGRPWLSQGTQNRPAHRGNPRFEALYCTVAAKGSCDTR